MAASSFQCALASKASDDESNLRSISITTTPTPAPTPPVQAPTKAPTHTGQTYAPTPTPTASPTLVPTLLPTATPTPAPTSTSSLTLRATHFWDCNGGACDAATLTTPWADGQNDQYLYAAQYAPLNPADYGGSVYGEQIWATGAASDFLTELMGADDGCCGSVAEAPGGCGKCLLVRNADAVQADWSAVVMKKNRCPPWSNGCEAGNAHLDIAVPGYDNLEFSTANVCGDKPGTMLTKTESAVCGGDPNAVSGGGAVLPWYERGSDTTQGCDCSSLPEGTAEQRLLKSGCQLFTQWGWRSGNPTLTYRVVECPANFVAVVGAAFDANGPTGV